jgi:hypothetical protein
LLAKGLSLGGDHWFPFLDAIEEAGGMLHYEIGRAYYIETFGRYYVGRVREVTATAVVLDSAAWVAYTGRLSEFLAAGRADGMEVEPLGDGWRVPLAYVSGDKPWEFPLFTAAV